MIIVQAKEKCFIDFTLRQAGEKFQFKGTGRPEDYPFLEVVSGYTPAEIEEYDDDNANFLRDAKINKAVSQLDHQNDRHWNADGTPKVSAVKKLSGMDVTAQDIKTYCPGVMREQ